MRSRCFFPRHLDQGARVVGNSASDLHSTQYCTRSWMGFLQCQFSSRRHCCVSRVSPKSMTESKEAQVNEPLPKPH